MVQRAVRAGGTPPPADHSSEEEVERLGRDWVILRDCRLGRPARGGALPTVLMHPARGAAVLDILPSDTPGAVEALRARLDAARFPAIFAGHLPVVHLQVAPHRVAFLPSLLDDAFAAQTPLDLPGGDAWVVVAARALRAEQPAPRIEPSRHADGDAVRRPGRRRKAAAVRAAGAILLCLAALGGVLGLALNRAPAPAPEPPPVTAAVPPAPEVAPVTAAPPPAAEAATWAPTPPAPPPTPAPDPVPAVPAPPLAPAAQDEAAAPVRPVPAARRPAPPSAPVARPPAPPLPVPADITPAPGPEALLQPQQAAPVPTPPPSPPSRRPEAAAPVPQAAQAPQPPVARRAAERATPTRRQQQEAGAAQPAATASNAASRAPETTPDRCRRVSVLVGSGAPLAEADMRFFNQSCIRW